MNNQVLWEFGDLKFLDKQIFVRFVFLAANDEKNDVRTCLHKLTASNNETAYTIKVVHTGAKCL
eukprot:m.1579675 g.1579675  ORF g.1579675 m.1579675 type:complete len:64 (+) comp25315_c0_seq10:626-817(+)